MLQAYACNRQSTSRARALDLPEFIHQRLEQERSVQGGSKPHSALHKTSLSLNPNAKALTYKIYLYIFTMSPCIIYVVSDQYLYFIILRNSYCKTHGYWNSMEGSVSTGRSTARSGKPSTAGACSLSAFLPYILQFSAGGKVVSKGYHRPRSDRQDSISAVLLHKPRSAYHHGQPSVPERPIGMRWVSANVTLAAYY